MSGHFAATVRKQRKENVGAHSLSPFLFSPAYVMVPPTVEGAFLYSLGNLRGHINRIVSNPNPIRVTININHQTYYLDIKNKVLRKRV